MNDVIYELEGTVYSIGDEWSNDSKTFSKMSLVVMTTSSWKDKLFENYIELDFINEAMHLLGSVREGNRVSVRFVLQGRLGKDKYEGRAFTTLKAIRIDVLDATTTAQAGVSREAERDGVAAAAFVNQSSGTDVDGVSDLPF